MEKKEMYVAPEVEVLEVAVEKGYQSSTTFVPGGQGQDGEGAI